MGCSEGRSPFAGPACCRQESEGVPQIQLLSPFLASKGAGGWSKGFFNTPLDPVESSGTAPDGDELGAVCVLEARDNLLSEEGEAALHLIEGETWGVVEQSQVPAIRLGD